MISEQISRRNLALGIGFVLVSNVIFLGKHYSIKWAQLQASEVEMTRGVLQTAIFLPIFLHQKRKIKNEPLKVLEFDEKSYSNFYIPGLLMAYGFIISTISFGINVAVQLMPVGDLVVISFSSPVFSVFLERLLLKTPLTILSIFLSFTVIIGDTLVVQPSFIFQTQEYQRLNSSVNLTSLEPDPSILRGKSEWSYYLGVLLCLYRAVGVATTNIINTKLNRFGIKSAALMLVAGISGFMLSLVSLIFVDNRIVSGNKLATYQSLVLPLSGIFSMLAFWFIVLAIDLVRQPTLISMVRSTEILFSLVTDSIFKRELPSLLKFIGTLLVLSCVSCMSCHREITSKLTTIFSRVAEDDSRSNNAEKLSLKTEKMCLKKTIVRINSAKKT